MSQKRKRAFVGCFTMLMVLQETVSGLALSDNNNYSSRVIQTQYGYVQAGIHGGAVEYLGIPYAAPPTGNLRWQQPHAFASWTGVLTANQQPPGCPQKCPHPKLQCPTYFSEDCLYLNIYTPTHARQHSRLPVILFLHGGNFQLGGAGGPLYNGRYLATLTNTIVVVINYRLGPLGFMVISKRDNVEDNNLTGNYGILDQIAALRFIKDNIRNFGGDPEKITLYGQSAGAQSIAFHLGIPDSSRMFHQAIMSSLPLTLPYRNLTDAAKLGNLVAQLLGCSPTNLECLRSKPAKRVIRAGYIASAKARDPTNMLQSFNAWSPTIDGKLIHEHPFETLKTGLFQQKSIIIGETKDECLLYINLIFRENPHFFKVFIFLHVLLKSPVRLLKVMATYADEYSLDLREVLSRGCTDWIFTCPMLSTFQNHGVVYHYVFDHAISYSHVWGSLNACKGRACHGGELSLVFHNAPLGNLQYERNESLLADAIVRYWGNFAHTGDPNNSTWCPDCKSKSVYWSPYSSNTGFQSLVLKNPENVIVRCYRNITCAFWNQVGYNDQVWTHSHELFWLFLLVWTLTILSLCRLTSKNGIKKLRGRSRRKTRNGSGFRRKRLWLCLCVLGLVTYVMIYVWFIELLLYLSLPRRVAKI